jgi:hypothetical protein
MIWILIAGGSFLMLALAATIVAMRPENAEVAAPLPPLAAPAVAEIKTPVFSEPEFLAEAEKVARRFLDSESVEELLPLLRHPEITEPRLRRMYPDGSVTARGMSVFNINFQVAHNGSGHTVQVRTGDFSENPMTFFPSADGWKVDWESWVGWSEMPWEEFIRTRPTEPKLFRAVLTDVDYYNFEFNDEDKWRSFSLTSPDGEHSLFAYVESGSVLRQRLETSPDVEQTRHTLSLRYPPGATSSNQVLVDKWHADGWVIENENEP